NSVDTKAQSEYIYNTLDDSIKSYFDSFENAVTKRLDQAREQRDRELAAEIERLRGESKKIDDARSAMKERQLSADRQKRALGDRVRELEQQIATLDSEREQLQLENRSMLNKLKVAQVQGCDQELADKCRQLQAVADELAGKNDSLVQENARLHEAVDKQSDMHAISEAMMGDLRQSAAKAREEVNRQKQELEATVKELELTKGRLTEAEAIVSEAQAVNEQLAVLVAELDKREVRIGKLKKEKADLRRQLEAARAELETVAADRPATAYGADLSAPEAAPEFNGCDTSADTGAEQPKVSGPGPKMPRITDEALDELDEQFNNETWTTDSHESSKPTIDKETPRQSRRKHNPADDVQLSLF
ncbi:MAG: hypothetical protein K2L80_02910, partial [Muribaculaceae bacterium]|nr:hypothetical protein [Muribaculaceae bacterium]